MAITVPLLLRGFDEPKTAIKRQGAVIVDNMCKLVEDKMAIEQNFPKIIHKLDRVVETESDPECRGVAERAKNTLVRVSAIEEEALKNIADTDLAVLAKQSEEQSNTHLTGLIAKQGLKVAEELESVIRYLASMAAFLSARAIFDDATWTASFTPALAAIFGDAEAKKLIGEYLALCIKEDAAKKPVEAEELEEGEDLCNCEFSLGYGGMVLLNNAKLRLKRGKRYGLCGPNGSGKTTLMRAIANGQLEGFPSAEEVRTVYVAHELQGAGIEDSVLDFIFNNPRFANADKEEVVSTLESVGFTPEMHSKVVDSLSGGWKMKLELAVAMLLHADILLLDEPTNHLDVSNVAWLEKYLVGLKNVTCMIVSHDSGFLDNICTHIVHYEDRKLKTYRGNLSEFVKVKPEAKTYYELSATQISFSFPEPGLLEGIKSKDKAILKMANITFAYPGATSNQIHNMTVQCSLSSRVAIRGPNGAGKSTMVKILTGELLPTTGEVWKHPHLRVAYVAQHAFHHLEQHLDSSPNQYIQWRYRYGEDREALKKASNQIPETEMALFKKPITVEVDNKFEKRLFEEIFGRRKLKNSFEYEVKWVGKAFDQNTWHPRNEIEKWGFVKTLQLYDDKEAALAGTYKRPLTQDMIEKHLAMFGLEAEFATHRHIRGLSGGQKVKVVLAAACWDCPHMVIMDEPTNYLDRDSLGALSNAIKGFGGGVVLISHHHEFTAELSSEFWNVEAGVLTIDGQVGGTSKEKIEWKQEEEMKDAFGNVTKVKAAKKDKLSRKEQREKDRKKKLAAKNGVAIEDSEEEDF